jgi:hypothetical protein
MVDSGQLESIVNNGGSVELGWRVGVVTVPESANMEDNIAYSRLAASDPNAIVRLRYSCQPRDYQANIG